MTVNLGIPCYEEESVSGQRVKVGDQIKTSFYGIRHVVVANMLGAKTNCGIMLRKTNFEIIEDSEYRTLHKKCRRCFTVRVADHLRFSGDEHK